VAVVVAAACVIPMVPAAAAQEAPPPTVPGPVDPGYAGPAYLVPAVPDAGDPNAVVVPVVDATGEEVGTERLEAGEDYSVEVGTGPDGDVVSVDLDGGRTALGDRRDFWVMPPFVALKDLVVTVDGDEHRLGYSGVDYHRGRLSRFDDAETPEFEGIPDLAREALACEADDWSIGQATYTVDFIELGVHIDDRELIDKGIAGLRWGTSLPFDDEATHQLVRECDGGAPLPEHGATHHTTQWLESMSRAVYLMAASRYAGELHDVIEETLDRIDVVATGLTDQRNWSTWLRNLDTEGHVWTHRTYMMAAALGLASTLTDDPVDAARWAQLAETIARLGIANQWGEDDPMVGVNPERGGYDLLYHMYGVWLAQLYLGTLGEQSQTREELLAAIRRAVQWELTRIDPETGRVDVSGSSRTCTETNWATGTAIGLDVGETIRGLLLWGQSQSDDEAVEAALRVHEFAVENGTDCADLANPEVPPSGLPATTDDDGRGFDTPIGALSVRRVLAAVAAGVLALVVLSRLRLARWSRPLRLAVRLGVPLAVVAAGLLALAA
jgi:hypothetical protein